MSDEGHSLDRNAAEVGELRGHPASLRHDQPETSSATEPRLRIVKAGKGLGKGTEKASARKNVRNRLVAIRLSREDYEALRSISEANNIGVSTWARERLQEHLDSLNARESETIGPEALGANLALITRNLCVLEVALRDLQLLIHSTLGKQET